MNEEAKAPVAYWTGSQNLTPPLLMCERHYVMIKNNIDPKFYKCGVCWEEPKGFPRKKQEV